MLQIHLIKMYALLHVMDIYIVTLLIFIIHAKMIVTLKITTVTNNIFIIVKR